MSNALRISIVACTTIFALVAALPLITNAEPGRAQNQPVPAEARQQAAQARLAERQEAMQTKLTDQKLKVCQKREKNITKIMTRRAEHGARQVAVFTKISDRTQAFYTTKDKVLSNYQTLVDDVTAKKIAAEAAIVSTKATIPDFKCDGTEPKGAAASFKASVDAQKAAIKQYKTAVKNLIVGVKSIQGTTSSSSEGSQQ